MSDLSIPDASDDSLETKLLAAWFTKAVNRREATGQNIEEFYAENPMPLPRSFIDGLVNRHLPSRQVNEAAGQEQPLLLRVDTDRTSRSSVPTNAPISRQGISIHDENYNHLMESAVSSMQQVEPIRYSPETSATAQAYDERETFPQKLCRLLMGHPVERFELIRFDRPKLDASGLDGKKRQICRIIFLVFVIGLFLRFFAVW
jgi:hypothetical protein